MTDNPYNIPSPRSTINSTIKIFIDVIVKRMDEEEDRPGCYEIRFWDKPLHGIDGKDLREHIKQAFEDQGYEVAWDTLACQRTCLMLAVPGISKIHHEQDGRIWFESVGR